jgi:HPt (histidine-containing phosphotransfer) domain-containing protein
MSSFDPHDSEPLDSHLLDSAALDALLDATGGDPAFLAEMIDSYLADSVDLFAAIDAALASGRTDEVRRAAHSLKSNSATFGAMSLADTCRQIEERAKAGDLDGTVVSLIESASAEFVRVRDVLRATRTEL